mmetsp:Transcript_92406/g.275649  ORF Transcript_92406/g.275649 Transcript_92406/m.275649 type:complete len:203 (+) Transcript_92406:1179-1787(+)
MVAPPLQAHLELDLGGGGTYPARTVKVRRYQIAPGLGRELRDAGCGRLHPDGVAVLLGAPLEPKPQVELYEPSRPIVHCLQLQPVQTKLLYDHSKQPKQRLSDGQPALRSGPSCVAVFSIHAAARYAAVATDALVHWPLLGPPKPLHLCTSVSRANDTTTVRQLGLLGTVVLPCPDLYVALWNSKGSPLSALDKGEARHVPD